MQIKKRPRITEWHPLDFYYIWCWEQESIKNIVHTPDPTSSPICCLAAGLCHILAYPTYQLPTPCSSRSPPTHAQRRAGLFGNTHNVGKLSKIIRQGYVGQQTDEWKIYQGQEIPENWYITGHQGDVSNTYRKYYWKEC